MVPILSIVGRSNSGKTTLLEKLIRELTQRGCRIGTIKHHFHGPVEVDVPGKDSWRHKRAGARVVALSAPETLFVVRDTAGESGLEQDTQNPSFTEKVERLEKELIFEALRLAGSNQSRAANQLGISERNLRYRLKKWGVK